MTQTRHIAHAEGWLAVATESDLCKVGKCIVAFNSFARLDQQYAASPDVKARRTPVYRVGDLFKNTQANAGAHIVSGTALDTGYLQILEGHSNVRVNKIPVARHDSACRINCDSTGMGGARGQIVTMTKTVAPAVAKPPAAPRVSKRLLELKALRNSLIGERLNLDALDEIVNFDGLNGVLDGWIAEIQGAPGTVADWDAQVRRGLLGGIKQIAVGTAELGYEGIKNVPKLIRRLSTKEGWLLAALDNQILLEDINLGNLSGESIAQDAGKIGSIMVQPVTNPWQKGQYVEATTRAGFELFTLLSAPVKALRATQAKKLLDLAKVKDAAAAASAATVSSTTGAVIGAIGTRSAGSANSAVTTTAKAAAGSPAVSAPVAVGSPAVSATAGGSSAVSAATAVRVPAVSTTAAVGTPVVGVAAPASAPAVSATAVAGAPAVSATPVVGPPTVSASAKPGASVAMSRGGVYVARAPKRARPPANGYTGPNAYKTHGIVDSPSNSPEGRKLMESYTDQGFPPAEAADKASNLMASGSTLPKAVELAPGESLYKLVPEGDTPGKYSAFFATKDEISSLKGMSYDQISDRLGIPLESQQTLRFDVLEVVANRKITVFESTIASTSQNGYLQPGGGLQTLITDRSAFTPPVLVGKLP